MSVEDKRLFLIRNTEELSDKNVDSIALEYEVVSDTRMVGEAKFGNYCLTIWDFGLKPEGEERKLCLQIEERTYSTDERPWQLATISGYYHGGGIADEIVGLSSLFLRRRLKLGPVVRFAGKPTRFTSGRLDYDIVKGEDNLERLETFFQWVGQLKVELHQRFILSARLYHRALLLIEEEPDLAYVNLISAVEALCFDYKVKTCLSGWDETIAGLVQTIEDEELARKLEEALLRKAHFIRKRFVCFILDHITEDFWKYDGRPEIGRINPTDLKGLLKRIYDYRSSFLHSGTPFPPSIYLPPTKGAEFPIGNEFISEGRKWPRRRYIPNPHFFERLVQHVLMTFLARNMVSE